MPPLTALAVMWFYINLIISLNDMGQSLIEKKKSFMVNELDVLKIVVER